MRVPSAFFISDAHLGIAPPGREPRQALLVRFLETSVEGATHLFVVGDLFDFWIEYELFIRHDYFPVLYALRRLVRGGTEVHYIAGNHDFALGPFLVDQIGLRIHASEYRGQLQGQRVLVMHGDGLLRGDFGYRLLRTVLRNRTNQRLYRMLLHPAAGVAVASFASRLSRRISGRPIPRRRLAAYRRAAARLLTRTPADIVVLGHTHVAELLEGPGGVYCNTGEWLRDFNYAAMQEGRIRLWQNGDRADPQEIQAQPW
jgi:UDP-2,3-diacylglucosamine hydrolase